MKSDPELELIWQDRVKAAWQRYREYHEILKHATLEAQGTGSGSDDEFIRQARKNEESALNEYTRVLGIYTDLVVSGKMPEEPGS